MKNSPPHQFFKKWIEIIYLLDLLFDTKPIFPLFHCITFMGK